MKISAALSQAIVDQQLEYTSEIYNDQCHVKDSVKQGRQKRSSEGASILKSVLSLTLLRAMELAAQEKGSSSWLSALPLKEYGLTLRKRAFQDALALRYGWTPSNLLTYCACGAAMSVEHALLCPKGGLPIARHNEVGHCSRLDGRSVQQYYCRTSLATKLWRSTQTCHCYL